MDAIKTKSNIKVKTQNLSKTRKNKKHESLRVIIRKLMCILNTVKLYHWNTDHYATHKATDELYGVLNGKIDEFVEIMLGKVDVSTRNKALEIHRLEMNTFKQNKDFIKETEEYKKFLLNLSKNKSFNILENSDLMNLRDEILGSLNKFLYLLTLN